MWGEKPRKPGRNRFPRRRNAAASDGRDNLAGGASLDRMDHPPAPSTTLVPGRFGRAPKSHSSPRIDPGWATRIPREQRVVLGEVLRPDWEAAWTRLDVDSSRSELRRGATMRAIRTGAGRSRGWSGRPGLRHLPTHQRRPHGTRFPAWSADDPASEDLHALFRSGKEGGGRLKKAGGSDIDSMLRGSRIWMSWAAAHDHRTAPAYERAVERMRLARMMRRVGGPEGRLECQVGIRPSEIVPQPR